MTALVINGDTSGSVTLQVPAAAGSSVHTLPAATGTVMVSGNMPVFSAYMGSTQAVSSQTYTKLNMDTKEFDTASCFNTSTYRFTPNVAGYYQFNAQIDNQTGSPSRQFLDIYKNGSNAKTGLDIGISTGNFNQAAGAVVNALIYANGTTDYFEVYVWCNGGFTVASGGTQCYFQGFLVRPA
jgi:hypothetical protein